MGLFCKIALFVNYSYNNFVLTCYSQLAERLEVSKFTGNFSVINAKDGSIITNSSNDILDFYANFTRKNYTKCK